MVGVLPIQIVQSNVSSIGPSSERKPMLGPMLETLDYTIRIGSTPTILYFDLHHIKSLPPFPKNKNVKVICSFLHQNQFLSQRHSSMLSQESNKHHLQFRRKSAKVIPTGTMTFLLKPAENPNGGTRPTARNPKYLWHMLLKKP